MSRKSLFKELPNDILKFNIIREFTQDEAAAHNITFHMLGAEKTESIFHTVLPSAEPVSESLSTQKIEEESVIQEEDLKPEGPQEFHPQSETDLATQIAAEYTNSIFAQKAEEVFIRRGVTQEQMPEALEHLFIRMAHKNIEAFKGDITQILYESEFNERDAENYIYWRFNEYTENNPMYLLTNGSAEALISDNFLTEELITLFYSQQETLSASAQEEQEINVVTSQKIDELLNEIENA